MFIMYAIALVDYVFHLARTKFKDLCSDLIKKNSNIKYTKTGADTILI